MGHTISLALAALGIIFAAFVKGVAGIGFPVIGTPIAALFCALSAFGFLLGIRFQRTISQQLFTKVVLAVLLLVGLNLLRLGVTGWR